MAKIVWKTSTPSQRQLIRKVLEGDSQEVGGCCVIFGGKAIPSLPLRRHIQWDNSLPSKLFSGSRQFLEKNEPDEDPPTSRNKDCGCLQEWSTSLLVGIPRRPRWEGGITHQVVCGVCLYPGMLPWSVDELHMPIVFTREYFNPDFPGTG